MMPVEVARGEKQMNRSYTIVIFVFVVMVTAGNLSARAEDINIHGFISQGYLKTNQNNYLAETDDGSFQFNEMGINFTTYVSDRLSLGCQFYARDLGDVGNDEIVINWAFAEFEYKNWLRLRVGTLKIPIGLYNDLRDFDCLRTSIFLPSSLYNEWIRDAANSIKGMEFFGTVGMGKAGLMEYQFQTGAMRISPDSGTSLFLEKTHGIIVSDIRTGNANNMRLVWTTPIDGLRFCVAGLHPDQLKIIGTNGLTIVNKDIYTATFSVEYALRNLKLTAENWWTKGKTVPYVFGKPIENQIINNDHNDSFYVSLGYRFTNWFEASFYYSNYIEFKNVHEDSNELKDHCLSFRFDINPFWIAKLEAHVMEGEFGVFPDNDGHTYNEWMLYAAKVSYSF